MKFKRWFYFFIHVNFISGFLYAFYHFINTPRTIFLHRRLWAYESWIILSFYSLFIFLILFEQEKLPSVKAKLERFRAILVVNLILLIFPWGLFLLFAPSHLMSIFGLSSIYWRILGGMSLLGAIIYYLPYYSYKRKITKYILIFGAIDNFLAGLVVVILFLLHKVPLIAFSASTLLFYFSHFFYSEHKRHKKIS